MKVKKIDIVLSTTLAMLDYPSPYYDRGDSAIESGFLNGVSLLIDDTESDVWAAGCYFARIMGG